MEGSPDPVTVATEGLRIRESTVCNLRKTFLGRRQYLFRLPVALSAGQVVQPEPIDGQLALTEENRVRSSLLCGVQYIDRSGIMMLPTELRDPLAVYVQIVVQQRFMRRIQIETLAEQPRCLLKIALI